MMKINWHRLFGLMLMDYFSDRGFRVELEKDLSQKRQYLDVVIVERKDEDANLSGICDGFDNLSSHNLIKCISAIFVFFSCLVLLYIHCVYSMLNHVSLCLVFACFCLVF